MVQRLCCTVTLEAGHIEDQALEVLAEVAALLVVLEREHELVHEIVRELLQVREGPCFGALSKRLEWIGYAQATMEVKRF